MNGKGSANLDRLMDLLADRATVGLSDAEARELAVLLAEHPEVAEDCMERAAAGAAMAVVGDGEPMPAGLRQKVQAQAMQEVRRAPGAGADGSRRRRPGGAAGLVKWGGWLAAAACLTVAVVAWWPRPGGRPSVAQLEAMPGSSSWTWSFFAPKPASEGGKAVVGADKVTGKVVWNTERQDGYLVFDGLPVNDPSREQYQLWILDPTINQLVDGGVFDATSGRAIVPITPKIRVRDVGLFAVTVERPGGVVVSDQTQRVVVAAPPKAG